jgi:hypothetical protein
MTQAYRIKREGVAERLVCSMLNLRPHYCPNCDMYFFGPRQTKRLHNEKNVPAPPNVQSNQHPHAGHWSH